MNENSVHRNLEEKAPDANDSILIDCALCELQGTEACDDCLVTYLCRSDNGSVVIELSEVRALRTLGQAGLLPDLKSRAPVGFNSER